MKLPLYLYLTCAGMLPFVFFMLCFIANITSLPLFGDTSRLLSVYTLIIGSFMAGSHWGTSLTLDNTQENNIWKIYLPVLSNITAIALWIGFLFLSFKPLLSVFVVTFLTLLLIDKKLHAKSIIDDAYFRIRCLVTLIVVVSLIISGIYA